MNICPERTLNLFSLLENFVSSEISNGCFMQLHLETFNYFQSHRTEQIFNQKSR